MIRFKVAPEAVWIKGDDPVFDDSEIGTFPRAERAKISFKIFPLTASLVDSTRKNHTEVKKEITFDRGKRVIQKTEHVDENAVAEDLLQQILRDWKGMLDVNGKEIKCTPEMKSKISDLYPGLSSSWVDAARMVNTKFEEEKETVREKESKN